MQYTLVQALAALDAAGAFPVSADTAARKGLLNEACQRLVTSGRFLGTEQVLNISINSSGVFTLPPQFLAVKGVKVDDIAVSIASKWWIFSPSVSTSLQQYETHAQVQGVGYPTFADISAASTLKIACSGATGTVRILGNDQSGNAIYDDDGEPGFELTINDSAWSTQDVSEITSVQMPVTNAPKTLSAKDEDATVTVIGLFSPGEETPSYTRYFIPQATQHNPNDLDSDESTVTALCQRQFVPAVSDSDLIFPSNLAALKNGCLSVHFENECDEARSTWHFDRAIYFLNQELRQSRADSEVGQIRIRTQGVQMGQNIWSTM